MEKILPIARQLSRARWLPPLVILLTLAMLGGTVLLGMMHLRESIRRQIVNRDGEVLDAVATLEAIGADSAEGLARRLEDTVGQLSLALRLSKLREGVLATRLFDARGGFVIGLPVLVKETRLASTELALMNRLQPASRYTPAARLPDYFIVAPGNASSVPSTVPLLSVLVPIHAPDETNLLAVAEFILDGRSIARDFEALDASLARQALLAFLVSGGILVAALAWAFRSLNRLNARLQEQACNLRRANQELALAAKTSALGAVTAHLIHGLTSPLTGLRSFVAAHAEGDAESQDALQSTDRMQALIGETVRLLSEENGDHRYEIPLGEVADILIVKMQKLAQDAGVILELRLEAEAVLANRDANLLMLILENLLRNAIEATPHGRSVRLLVAPADDGIACDVEDEGRGLPGTARQNLFAPCRSTKAGGSGLGLAISKQLARHLGGELELVRSSEAGCVFRLVVPKSLLNGVNANARSPVQILAQQ